MEIKFDVYFKKNLGTLFKSNEVDLDGIPAHTNLDLNLVDRLEANYKVGTQKYTDSVGIVDIEERVIQIPFKSDVVKVGLNEFEIVAYMLNGDIKVSQTYTYNIDEGIGEGKQTGSGGSSDGHTHSNLNVLNSITQTKISEWNNKADATHIHSEYANITHTHSEYLKELPTHEHSEYLTELPSHEHEQYLTEHQDISHKADKSDIYTKLETDNKISEEIAKAQLGGSGEVDLSAYATKNYVDDEISKIELKEGPQGPQGPQGLKGEFDVTTVFDELSTEDKTVIGAINEMKTEKLSFDSVFKYKKSADLSEITLKNADNYLDLPTYDGSNQCVHSKVLYFKNSWNGYKFWMAMTPLPYYPVVNENLENPSILVSQDGSNWIVPPGLTNPIDNITRLNEEYNSDTHLVYNPNKDELECWYRHFNKSPKKETIYKKTSKDGVNWSEKVKILENENTERFLLCPIVIFDENIYKVWFISTIDNLSYNLRYYESEDGIELVYKRNISFDNDQIWHGDIIKTKKGYEFVCQINKNLKCIYSRSEDGVEWSPTTTILNTSTGGGWDSQYLYRPSITEVEGDYYFYYTGRNDAVTGARQGLIKVEGESESYKLSDLFIKIIEGGSTTNIVNVDGISLDNDNIVLGVGETFKINAQLSPSNATNKNIRWESTNQSIAKVLSNGEVQAIKTGECIINAITIDGGFVASCDVSVVSDNNDSIVTNGLVCYLDASLKGDDQNIWKDLSKNNNDARLINFTHNGSNGWVEDKLEFDGENKYCEIPNANSVINKSVTMSFILSYKTFQGRLFGGDYDKTIYIPNFKDKIVFWRGNASFEPKVTDFLIGQKYYIDVVHDIENGKVAIYIDGAMVAEQNIVLNDAVSSYDKFGLGNSLGSNIIASTFCGSMYGFKLYNRALSEAEIIKNYNIEKVK